MRQTGTTLRPSFASFVGIFSVATFPCWLLLVVADLLGLRASAARIDHLWVAGVLYLVSILAASPSLFFRLRFLDDHLQFRWFGRTWRAVPYGQILRFEFPLYRSFGGLRIHLPGEHRDVYWVELQHVADLLKQHGVPHAPAT